jgi:hypothetical protein
MKILILFCVSFLFNSKIYSQLVMDENVVWSIIDSINQVPSVDREQKEQLLTNKLAPLSDVAIVTFDFIMHELHGKANTWDLVAVDKILSDEGMMSEDNHFDFGFELISLGKKAFYEIVGNPDKITDYISTSNINNPLGYNSFIRGHRALSLRYVDYNTEYEISNKILQKLSDEKYPDKSVFLNKPEYDGYKAKTLKELQERLPRLWQTFSACRNYEELFYFWLND